MATTGTEFFIRRSRWTPRTFRTCSSSSSSLLIRSRIWRRSDSNFVSPGPRVPMPPPCRDRLVPMPESLGSRYLYWASSTWRRPSLVLARWAKMSRIRALRSITGTPIISSKARILPGDSSLSKITMVDSVASTSIFTSMAFPSPIKLWESGVWRFWSTLPVQKPPAVSSRASSSSKVSSVAVCSFVNRSAFSPTSTARSWVCFSKFPSILPPLPHMGFLLY